MSNEVATTTEPAEKKDGDTLVFKGHLFRKRRGRGYVFTEKPPEPKPVQDPVRRPARVAQMLAFAHGLGAAIERGDFRDQADAARHFQLTRARITQLMNLTLLAPDIQEQVLYLEAVDGREPMSERDLRVVIYAGDWVAQRVIARRLFLGLVDYCPQSLCQVWSPRANPSQGAGDDR